MPDVIGYGAMITVGGVGTRLLPFSKEVPKEMFPLPCRGSDDDSPHVKPIVQAIFEQLYDVGVRDYYFVVGRGKRAIEDHFTPDQAFLDNLKGNGKNSAALLDFYEKVDSSNLVFLNQSKPLGFGDAVLRGRHVIDGTFIVHAGDTVVISKYNKHLIKMSRMHEGYRASATLLVREVDDPRMYGVVEGENLGEGVLEVSHVVEKPDGAQSRLAIMPVYIFSSQIFEALSLIPPGRGGELQLTDGIEKLVRDGHRVIAVRLQPGETSLDFGSPQSVIEAFRLSSTLLEEGTTETSVDGFPVPRTSRPSTLALLPDATIMGTSKAGK